jgi:glycosyltransferase involved in cell wall biosynthesis
MRENKATSILVSIIVPIYDVEKYISKCVDSILKQTYKDLEIILVDDGSRDNCPKICDEYASNDNRIQVIHKKNGGLSDARNAGLNKANGKYVAFIDSDDYIHEQYIELLMDSMLRDNADIAVCGFEKVYSYVPLGRDQSYKTLEINTKTLTNIDAIKDIFSSDTHLYVMTWNKLYATNLFKNNNIMFPIDKIHEDNFTTYKLFYYSTLITFIDLPLYYYYQRNDSIIGRDFDYRRLDSLEAIEDIKVFFSDKNLKLNQEIEYYSILILISLINDLLSSSYTDKQSLNILVESLEEAIEEAKNNRLVKFRHRLMAKFIIINPAIYIKCIKLVRT